MNNKNLIYAVSILSLTSFFSYSILNVNGICNIFSKKQFKDDFIYMTTTPEACYGDVNCDLNLPHWKDDIEVAFLYTDNNHDKLGTIQGILNNSFSVLEKTTGLKFNLDSKDANLIILLTDDDMIKYVEEGNLYEIDQVRFENGIKSVYLQGGCSAHLAMEKIEESQFDRIAVGFIFVNTNLSGRELESCIYEELIGSVGLIGDPKGQASLFDNENYSVIDGKFGYSKEILLMLDAVYKIVNKKTENIDTYIRDLCN